MKRPEAVLRVVTFEGGGGLQDRESRAVTLSLGPGVTYVALDTSGDNPRRFSLGLVHGRRRSGHCRRAGAAD